MKLMSVFILGLMALVITAYAQVQPERLSEQAQHFSQLQPVSTQR